MTEGTDPRQTPHSTLHTFASIVASRNRTFPPTRHVTRESQGMNRASRVPNAPRMHRLRRLAERDALECEHSVRPTLYLVEVIVPPEEKRLFKL